MHPKTWTWHDVKCELAKRGYTIKSFAEKIGVTPQAVGKVKHSRSTRVEHAIARAIHRDASEIWPYRYDAKGNPTYRAWRNRHRNRHFRTRRAA